VAIDDLLGRWCVTGSGNFNIFSKTQLLVQFPNGTSRTLEISRTEVNGNHINVYWAGKGGANNTIYDISDDRRTLVQVPNTTGDLGPRRELHRC
jgi:hypothetical protein